MSALQRQNDELLQNVPTDSDCTRRGETEQSSNGQKLGFYRDAEGKDVDDVLGKRDG